MQKMAVRRTTALVHAEAARAFQDAFQQPVPHLLDGQIGVSSQITYQILLTLEHHLFLKLLRLQHPVILLL